MSRLINAIGFQAAWWLSVLSVRHEFEAVALGLCAAMAAAHLAQSRAPQRALQLGGGVLALGILADSCLQSLSIIQFQGHALDPLSPFWSWGLWFVFALTLHSSFAFLLKMPIWRVAALGMVVGPLTYHAGSQLGAAEFTPTLTHVLILALTWMFCLPMAVTLAQRFPQPSEGCA